MEENKNQDTNAEAKKIEAPAKEKKEVKKVNEPAKEKKEVKEVKEPAKEKKEVNKSNEPTKEKKNHKILKVILVIILILLVLFIIHFIRNSIIINKIAKQQMELLKETNYSYTIEKYLSNDENSKKVLEYYCKDDKIVLVNKADDSIGIVWSDKNSKEEIFLSPKDLKAIISTGEVSFIHDVSMFTFGKDSSAREIAFLYCITTEKVNNQECYKIKWTDTTIWINKENGIPVKLVNSNLVIDNEKIDSVTEWKNWKTNQLTDEDVSRPNLTGYDIANKEVTENNQ